MERQRVIKPFWLQGSMEISKIMFTKILNGFPGHTTQIMETDCVKPEDTQNSMMEIQYISIAEIMF